MKYAGINIAGFDFGCLTDGSQTLKNVNGPIGGMGGDGAGQMNHFTKDDHMNVFRLPIGWQYLTNNNVGGNLDSSALSKYDGLMQSCLKTGALCIIDIHNYARWNGKIIGQGGPTNDQFVALWKALATKYKGNAMVAFGLMNEPHEVDLAKWAETLQLVVAAIRGAGAATHLSKYLISPYGNNGGLHPKSPPSRKRLHFRRTIHLERLRCCTSNSYQPGWNYHRVDL